MYAHSVAGRPRQEWERLSEHLARVAQGAGDRADVFGWRAAAEALARLHDIGKASEAFQHPAWQNAPSPGFAGGGC